MKGVIMKKQKNLNKNLNTSQVTAYIGGRDSL